MLSLLQARFILFVLCLTALSFSTYLSLSPPQRHLSPPSEPTRQTAALTADATLINGLYVDWRLDRPLVRLAAFRQCARNASFDLKLAFIFADGRRTTVVPNLVLLDGNNCPWHWAPSCSWNSHFLTARLPPDYGKVTKIELSESGFSWALDKVKHVPDFSKHGHELVVCVVPLYLYGDWPQMVQFIESWRLQGATKFIIYTTSITKAVHKILNAYERVQLVTRVPWPLLPKNAREDPNKSLYRFGHTLAMNDCVLRTAGWAKFVASVDFDEFVFPANSDLILLDFLNKLAGDNPLAGSFRFAHRRLYFPKGFTIPDKISPRALNFDWMTDLVTKDTPPGPSKVIYRPERTEILQNHAVRSHFGSYKSFVVPQESALLYHLRKTNRLESLGDSSHQERLRRFKSLTPSMRSHFVDVVRVVFDPDRQLDSGKAVIKGVTRCLTDWKNSGCKTPHEMCEHLLREHPTNWVISDDSESYLIV